MKNVIYNLFIKSICAVCLALLTISASAEKTFQVNTQKSKAANELLKQWDRDDEPGVAVAIMQNSKLIYSNYVGMADLEQFRKIKSETVFQVASISKQFTAFAILLLEKEGKLSLNDSIREYVPNLQPFTEAITIQHLLDHTGGLREISSLTNMAGWKNDDVRTKQQYRDLLARQLKGNFEPGSDVQYSNTGYFLLSEIVAKVSGQKFEDFMQAKVFKPLEMHNTQFNKWRDELIKNYAQSYQPYNDTFLKVLDPSEAVGSTGLLTTATDLLKWNQNLVKPKVGNEKVIAKMLARTKASNGEKAILAKGQEKRLYKDLITWSHGGRVAGYRSYAIRVPDADFSVVVLSNRADFVMADIAFTLVDIFLSKHEMFEPKPGTEFDKSYQQQLESYVGDYELFPGLILSFFIEDNALFMNQLNTQGKVQLNQIGDAEFLLNPKAKTSIRFISNEAGLVEGIEYVLERNGVIKAPRIDLENFNAEEVDFDDYLGSYFSDELLAHYEIKASDSELIAKHLRLSPIVLKAYQVDTFNSTDNSFQKVEFVRNKEGKVIGMNVSGVYADNVYFERL